MKEFFPVRMSSFRLLASVATLVAVQSATVQAQSAKEFIQLGDKETAARKGDPALKAYEDAIRVDSMNVEALRKAATTAVALAEFGTSTRSQSELVNNAELWARRAFGKDSTSGDAHFVMAQALGRAALLGGQMAQLKYAPIIYNHAERCLKVQPKNSGCAHILGNWHLEVMRRSAFERKMASMMSKSPLFDSASWDKAKGYMEQAVASNPQRTIHHLILGQVYADMKMPDKARAEFKAAQAAPVVDFNDEKYKEMATDGMKKLEDSKGGK